MSDAILNDNPAVAKPFFSFTKRNKRNAVIGSNDKSNSQGRILRLKSPSKLSNELKPTIDARTAKTTEPYLSLGIAFSPFTTCIDTNTMELLKFYPFCHAQIIAPFKGLSIDYN